jgi:phage-related protein
MKQQLQLEIGQLVVYKGRIYEVVDIAFDGFITITNGRLSELELEVCDIEGIIESCPSSDSFDSFF